MTEKRVTRRAFGEKPTPAEVAAKTVSEVRETASGYTGTAAYHRTVQQLARLAADGLERYERSREDELRGATGALREEIDRERQRADAAEREAAALREAMSKNPTKEVEPKDEFNRIRFPQPANGTRGHRRWTVSDFESIAYDCRLAGAMDDAPIEVYTHAFVAEVPFPEAIANSRGVAQQPKPDPPLEQPTNVYDLPAWMRLAVGYSLVMVVLFGLYWILTVLVGIS